MKLKTSDLKLVLEQIVASEPAGVRIAFADYAIKELHFFLGEDVHITLYEDKEYRGQKLYKRPTITKSRELKSETQNETNNSGRSTPKAG